MGDMMSKCAENVIGVLKNQKLQECGIDSLENLMKIFLTGDWETGIELTKSSGSFMLAIPNIIYLDKLKRFLSRTYRCYEDQIRMASKFDENKEGYVDFVKKVLSYLNDMEEDEKVDCFSNLMRSCLLNLIDIPLFFKMVNILKRLTSDELKYLSDNIVKPVSELNIYIETYISYGLAKMILSTPNGKNKYAFTSLAKYFVNFGLLLDSDDFEKVEQMITIRDIEVIEPRTTGAFERRDNGNISLSREFIKK